MVRAVHALLFIALAFARPASAEFLQDGSYRTNVGFIIDKSCLGSSANGEREFNAIKFEAVAERVISKTQVCAQSQLLAGLENKIFKIIQSHPRLTCFLNTCASSNASACAEVAKNTINLNENYALSSPATWFHEVLHLAEFDNQNVTIHNLHTDESDARDTIKFWERTCFKPEKIKEVASRGIEACRSTLNYWPEPKSPMQSEFIHIARDFCPNYQNRIAQFQTALENSLFFGLNIQPETERSIGFMRKIFRAKLTFDFTMPRANNLDRWKSNHCNHGDDAFDLQKCVLRFKDDVIKFLAENEVVPGYCLNKKETAEISDYLYSLLTKF